MTTFNLPNKLTNNTMTTSILQKKKTMTTYNLPDKLNTN